MSFFKLLASKYPQLSEELHRARMNDTPEMFAKKTFVSALYLSFFFLIIVFFLTKDVAALKRTLIALVVFLLGLFVIFNYFLNMPMLKTKKKEKLINSEIVFATQFLIVEISSGIPLYNAFKTVAKNYEYIGAEFQDILSRVNLGTSLEDAIREAIEFTPSDNLRKIFWQLNNSIRSGSDASYSLKSVLAQIVREQRIEVDEYGRKLNPLAMFYMMIAVIIPSLGIIMLVVLASFMNLNLELWMLMILVAGVGFMQFMFITMVKSNRPSVEL